MISPHTLDRAGRRLVSLGKPNVDEKHVHRKDRDLSGSVGPTAILKWAGGRAGSRVVPIMLAVYAPLSFIPRAGAQDLTRQLATADTYFEHGILPEALSVFLDPTLDGALKGAFTYRFAASVVYDSNVNLSSTNEEDDIYFSLSPSIAYTSDPEGGARHSITAYYSPNPQIYQEDSSRGRFNHNGGISYRFQGSRTSISAFLRLAQASEPDRFTDGYSEGTVASLGLRASYQIAPRTSIYGSLSSSYLSYSSAGQEGGDYTSTSLGAWWSATERLALGPSVRYRWSESDNTGSRTALGLLLNVSYEMSELISLSASIGVESVESGLNDAELRMTGGLSFRYQLNPIWTWTGSISYADIPSPSTFGYAVNDLTVSTAVSRALGVGNVSAFVGYSKSQYKLVQITPAERRTDSNYYRVGIAYSRPFFTDRIAFSSSISYLGSTGDRDWNKWIVALSWSTSF